MNKSEGTEYRVQGTEPAAAREAQVEEQVIEVNGSANGLVKIEAQKPLTLDEVRAKLAGQKGKKFWRSVDELADAPEFAELVNQEFPSQASEWIDPVSRRTFL
ncbi:MAG: TAT-variant-translocated molybdopterin oxidoreductase, partial [Acidobacteriaceae bacterium]